MWLYPVARDTSLRSMCMKQVSFVKQFDARIISVESHTLVRNTWLAVRPTHAVLYSDSLLFGLASYESELCA